jgi:hypothetical protein
MRMGTDMCSLRMLSLPQYKGSDELLVLEAGTGW